MLSILLAAMLSASAADETFSWDSSVDVPVLVGAGGLYAMLYFQVEDSLPVSDSVATPGGLDALVEPHWNPGSATVSDVVMYGTMGASFGVAVVDGVLDGGGAGLRFGLVAEALAIDGVLTDTLKLAVRRPRPYTQLDPTLDPELAEMFAEPDRDMSFPSGHTSMVAATSFSAARIVALSDSTATQRVVAYGLASALTVSVGTLRITAGKHHPTDVLGGACLGLAVGWLVPTLHHTERRAVSVTAGPRYLGLRGRF